MSDSHRPVQSPPPFPTPILLSARRTTGTVLTEISGAVKDTDPPLLERHSSIAGNLLLVQDNQDPKAKKRTYLLQRKIKDSLHGGSVRVGFVIRDPSESEAGLWELVPGADGAGHEMVAVKIQDKAKLKGSVSQHHQHQDPMNELSALQWITANDPEGKGHLLGPTVLAEDDTSLYVITPYQKEGTLFDYCDTRGTLSEAEARFFFLQMLEGLENLKGLELCHRNLSLDSVLFQGNSCTFAHMVHALRIPCGDEGMVHLIEPQAPCGTSPQYIAPEILKNEPFDGGAVDLWSVGVILFAMLLGDESLFDAPIPEDKKFKEICIRGNLKNFASSSLSADAVDLLQGMLRALPRDRLTLEAVRAHPWVKAEEVTIPGKIETSSLNSDSKKE